MITAGLLGILAVGSRAEAPAQTPPDKPAAVPNSECLDCHEAEFKPRKKGLPPEWIGVKSEAFAHAAHAKQACVDCHASITETPHASKLPKVDCLACHRKEMKQHAFHPRLQLAAPPEGPDTNCRECHSAHETVAVKADAFPFHDGGQTEACGRCHAEEKEGYRTSAHGGKAERAQRLTPDCLTCHKEQLTAGKSPLTVELKLAQAKLCESCHINKAEVADRSAMGGRFVASYDKSVHGAALNAGKAGSASCADCHGAHAMNKAAVAGAHINPLHITETCAPCHEKQAREYRLSVHASALAKGNTDSAGCTRCHGEHDIRGHNDPASPVNKSNLAKQVCAECHASVRLTRRYGMAGDTYKTFSDSYHGLAVRGGTVSVVNCASCHGNHAIRSQLDPKSSVNKQNLAQTCGECHPGANTRFSVGVVHASENQRDSSPLLYWIARIYTLLITVVIGGMMIHNALDFFKKTRRKLDIQRGRLTEPHIAHRLYLRMTAHERIQHFLLAGSFVALGLSGFMLRYPEAWWVVGLRQLSDRAFEWRSLGHRVAGVVMILTGLWHVAYLAFTKPGRKLFLDLLPRWRDVTDPWGVLRYNLGLAPEKPAFGRFCYIEKLEYWALVWGVILMGVTGGVLWFENASMGYFSKLGFDVARTIHFYEAILAVLAVFVWHIYFVVFNPDVYPMNLAWLTGRMSEGEMLEEHPLQLEELKAMDQAGTAPASPPGNPPAGDKNDAKPAGG